MKLGRLTRHWRAVFTLGVIALSIGPQTHASVLSEADGAVLLNESLLATLVPKNLVHPEASTEPIGFELGLTLGVTATGALRDSLASLPGTQNAASDVDNLPVLPQLPALYGQVAIPYGLAFESQFLPSLNLSSAKLSYYTLGLRWDYLRFFIRRTPWVGAVRLSFLHFGLNYKDDYIIQDQGWSLLHTIGREWNDWFSVWLGYGFVTSRLDLEIDSTSVIFSESPRSTGLQLSLGALMDAGSFNWGLEWANISGVNCYTTKFGFQF